MNQYDSVGGAAYTYDDNGNLTNTPTSTYTYDYENRLVSYSLAPGGEGQGEGAYSYDAFGRRIKKEVTTSYELRATSYIHDGDQVICEYDSTGSLTAKYIHGPGIDEPICRFVIANEPEASEAIYYYHFDGLGSVTNLTDVTGTIVESYTYDVYGKPNTTSNIGNPYLFTGREYDKETGLYYYRARYYDPGIGRFLQRDPIGYRGGINLYSYVENNPVNFIDPFGQCKDNGDQPWWDDLDDRLIPDASADEPDDPISKEQTKKEKEGEGDKESKYKFPRPEDYLPRGFIFPPYGQEEYKLKKPIKYIPDYRDYEKHDPSWFWFDRGFEPAIFPEPA